MTDLRLPHGDGFNTAVTPCVICCKPVRYYVSNFRTNTKRRVPSTHRGQCADEYRMLTAQDKARRIKLRGNYSQRSLAL